MYTRVMEFAMAFRLQHFAKVGPKDFADCLTATVVMYYRDTFEAAPHHIPHQELERVHGTLPRLRSCREDLLEWGQVIRKRFTTDNILSLPVHVIKDGLSIDGQAKQFGGVHTFSDTLQRLLTGYQQLASSNDELKALVYRVLDLLDSNTAVATQQASVCRSCAAVVPIPIR